MSIKKGDQVVLRGSDYEGLTGEVHALMTSRTTGLTVAVVKVSDTDLIKCLVEDLEVITPEDPRENETITITRKDFREIAIDYMLESKSSISPYDVAIVCSELEKAFFDD